MSSNPKSVILSAAEPGAKRFGEVEGPRVSRTRPVVSRTHYCFTLQLPFKNYHFKGVVASGARDLQFAGENDFAVCGEKPGSGTRPAVLRRILGSHRISAKHMPAYLDEIAWRFNNRKNPFLFRDTMLKLIHSENLEYKELTKAA